MSRTSQKTERFYDLIQRYGLRDIPEGFPAHQSHEMQQIRAGLLDEPVILAADNVVSYFEENEAGFSYDFASDCPNLAPPFEGGVFIETANPGIHDARQEGSVSPTRQVSWWGIYIESEDFARHGEGWQAEALSRTQELGDDAMPVRDCGEVSGTVDAVPRWHLSYSLFFTHGNSPVPFGPVIGGVLAVGEDGSVVQWSDGTYISIGKRYGQSEMDADSASLTTNLFRQSCFALFLAISFCHCKNVYIEQIPPRDMRSKKARKRNPSSTGEKHSVRHHTLNIEPMKEVLSTEGDIEERGLKRALHITRGHFKHYTPERGGLFGRHIDEPETVWVSQHVRGKRTTREVVKDYRVDRPASTPSWGEPERRERGGGERKCSPPGGDRGEGGRDRGGRA